MLINGWDSTELSQWGKQNAKFFRATKYIWSVCLQFLKSGRILQVMCRFLCMHSFYFAIFHTLVITKLIIMWTLINWFISIESICFICEWFLTLVIEITPNKKILILGGTFLILVLGGTAFVAFMVMSALLLSAGFVLQGEASYTHQHICTAVKKK